jgi:predicted PurR-regulated permease PerM
VNPSIPERVRLDVSWLTILKILSAVALVWVWLQIWPIVLVVLVSLTLAVTLEPVVCWLEARKLSRGMAVLLVGAVPLILAGVLITASLTPLTQEATLVVHQAVALQERIASGLPVAVARVVRRGPQDPTQMMTAIAGGLPAIGGAVLGAAAMTLFAFILTLYLLADGRRTYEWLIAYVPAAQQDKAHETVDGVTEAVFAYVAANLLTSLFATIFIFVSLALLQVPAAFMLAILAGVLDFVPILGFFVALTPAVVIGLTVSSGTGVAVVGVYMLCSVIENYGLAPKLYGHHLKVSRVAVLLGLVAGAAIGGIIGAVLALPVVAAYPIVERIWLRKSLGKAVLAEHARLERDDDEDNRPKSAA